MFHTSWSSLIPILQELLLRQNLRSNLKFPGWKKGIIENFGGSSVSFAPCDCKPVKLWAGGLVELKIKFFFLGKETSIAELCTSHAASKVNLV